MKIGSILLAGGTGSRMGKGNVPKQFLPLNGSPVALHSFRLFEACDHIQEMVVVALPRYHSLFTTAKSHRFASPGERRQDSVFNGLQEMSSNIEWVLIHDAARPFLTPSLIDTLCLQAEEVEAACLAVPLKFTVKEACRRGFVKKTLDRSALWEIQTPQIIKRTVLEKGFKIAQSQNLTVTDDVSLAELVGVQVKLIPSCSSNIKITTPEDFPLAELIARRNL